MQVFAKTTSEIPVQVWSSSQNETFSVECAPATFAATQFNNRPFVPLPDIQTTEEPHYDPSGTAMYSASAIVTLPSECWRDLRSTFQDVETQYGYTYLSMLRIKRKSDGRLVHVFNKDGLECLGKANGAAASWYGYLSEDCQYTHRYTELGGRIVIAAKNR